MEGTDGGSSGVGFGSITRAEAAITGRGVWEFSKEKRREEREEKKRGWSERQEIMKLKEYLLVIDVSHTVSFKVKAF